MLLAGLIVLFAAAVVSVLDLLGFTPGAAGVVNVLAVVSVALLMGRGLQAAIHAHHLRDRRAHRG